MHPLLSTIHPTFRTAVVAWLLGRATVWSILWHTHGGWPWGQLSIEHAAHTPGWSMFVRMLLAMDAIQHSQWSTWAMVIAAELSLLIATGCVYHLSRRDTLPQSAERATWLWALCPLWVLLPSPSPWVFGISAALLALALIDRARYGLGMLMMVVAVNMQVDMVLVAPLFALLGFKAYAPGRAHPATPWACALGAHALVPLTIFSAMLLGGRMGVSLRTLHHQPLLNSWPAFEHITQALPWLATGALALLATVLCMLHRKQFPLFWLWGLIPILLWPLAFAQPAQLLPIALLSFPLFALSAKALDNPSYERVALMGSALGMIALPLSQMPL